MSKTVAFNEPHPKYPRLKIQLRSKSKFYQAWTFHDGRPQQHSTKTTSLQSAFKIGGEWYLKILRSKRPAHPRVATDASCAEIYAAYKNKLESKKRFYAEMKWRPIREFWGEIPIADISATTFHDFTAWRQRRDKVKTHTLHKDIVLIRQVLRYAAERDVIPAIPTIPKLDTIPHNPRPWLNKEEFSRLVDTSHQRIRDAEKNPRLHRQRKDCHDFFIFMYHSMMRVEELRRLRFGDCHPDKNDHGENILICDVDGKVEPREALARTECFEIWLARYEDRLTAVGDEAMPSEMIFTHRTRDAFKELLKAAKPPLYIGPKGITRNLKSIRCTSIATSVLADGDIFFIARNAGTSVHMIDTFYAKRLTSKDAKNKLTHFKKDEHPEMFAKFHVGPALPIPTSSGSTAKPAARSRKRNPLIERVSQESGQLLQQSIERLGHAMSLTKEEAMRSMSLKAWLGASSLTSEEKAEKTREWKRANNIESSSRLK